MTQAMNLNSRTGAVCIWEKKKHPPDVPVEFSENDLTDAAVTRTKIMVGLLSVLQSRTSLLNHYTLKT